MVYSIHKHGKTKKEKEGAYGMRAEGVFVE